MTAAAMTKKPFPRAFGRLIVGVHRHLVRVSWRGQVIDIDVAEWSVDDERARLTLSDGDSTYLCAPKGPEETTEFLLIESGDERAAIREIRVGPSFYWTRGHGSNKPESVRPSWWRSDMKVCVEAPRDVKITRVLRNRV